MIGQTHLSLLILIICVPMLTRCLLKIESYAVNCPIVQLMSAQKTMSDNFNWHGFYRLEYLEKLVTGPPLT